MALQMVNSSVESTRVWWRHNYWGYPMDIATDPRRLNDVLGERGLPLLPEWPGNG